MDSSGTIEGEQVFQFDGFHYFVQRRLLVERGRPLRVGSRALDILRILLEHAGSLVSKEQLLAQVWPTTVVEENNLRVHIAALRRVLGDCQIANVPLRGYRLTVQVCRLTGVVPERPRTELAALRIPPRLTPLEGRDPLIATLVRQLPLRRFITLLGPGGVGKSSVALRVAESLRDHYRDGLIVVDVSTLSDAAQLLQRIAAQLGWSAERAPTRVALQQFLRERHLLLVLDNGERLLGACAGLAEELLRAAARLSILVTSREALRAEGEYRQQVSPLACPAPGPCLDLDEALAYPALRVFVARARARQQDFALRAEEAGLLADICRRLDGLPLALELAAAQVEALGLGGIRRQLDDDFLLLEASRRTSCARHQSLRALLEWSHEGLSPAEQACFRCLAVFDGEFSLDTLLAVFGGVDPKGAGFPAALAQLVAKSLVTVQGVAGSARYRLLHSTRAYALARLKASGEWQDAWFRLSCYGHRAAAGIAAVA